MDLELLKIIALLCSASAGSHYPRDTMTVQRECQAELVTCYYSIEDFSKENFELKCVAKATQE